MDQDLSATLQAQVHAAIKARTPLDIIGGGSKRWYGRAPQGTPLHVTEHRGIVNYAPQELVLTARAGTPLTEIEAMLAEHNQMLPFEPPHYGPTATLGGTIACNLSGPRRPYAGAARDHVLGVRMINGRGEILRLGGEVMKNVAGYDVSRLMAGALGTLGVILEVSLKVLPRPAREITLAQPCDASEVIVLMNQWAARPLPISAAGHDGDHLYVRLSGAESAVNAASKQLGGTAVADNAAFWRMLREHTHDFFTDTAPLWRLSLPPSAPPLALPGRTLMDWGGAQRWLRGNLDALEVRAAAQSAGGHATLYRGGDRAGAVFHPLTPALATLHRRLKDALDPHGIFNRGRMYAEY